MFRFIGWALLMAAGAMRAASPVDNLFDWTANGPGAVVAVVDHGRVVFEKAYGYADLSRHLPLSRRSAFDLASITKQFTAMGIMILVERGKLSYDDSICRFFPEFAPARCDITVRNLLQHTSGLPDYEQMFHDSGLIATNYPRAARDADDTYEPTSGDARHFLARSGKMRFKPGEKWDYSDSGYVLLAQIIEKVSGEKYGDFLRQNIFRPAGMRHTIVYDERRQKIPYRALSYSTNGACIDYTPLNLIYGDGNVNTTIDDMVQWVRALEDDKLVSPAALQLAFTRGALNSGKQFDYGFGWGLHDRHGEMVVEHGGAWVGFRGNISYYPKRKLAVLILSNSTHGGLGQIAQQIETLYWNGSN